MIKMMTGCFCGWLMLLVSGCGTSELSGTNNGKAFEKHFPATVAAGAELTVVYNDDIFFEGPTWDPKTGKLYFTAWGDKKQVLRLDAPGQAVVWMDDTAGINGTFLSTTGGLLTAEVYAHQICEYQIGSDKLEEKKVLAHGADWHQPNDVCQTSRGDIYFTDPDWADKTSSCVYRLSPSGVVTKVIDDMTTPNGIIASNDGRILYVADSELKLWRSYPINANGSVGSGKIFFNPPSDNNNAPDGMTIDKLGNLYFTGRGGVWVVTPKGKNLGLIAIPEFASNVTFGGSLLKTLYITCQDKVYSQEMTVRGN